jgi:hypothetical protein
MSSMTRTIRRSRVTPATAKVGSAIARANTRFGIGKERKWQMQALDSFPLIVGVLGRET